MHCFRRLSLAAGDNLVLEVGISDFFVVPHDAILHRQVLELAVVPDGHVRADGAVLDGDILPDDARGNQPGIVNGISLVDGGAADIVEFRAFLGGGVGLSPQDTQDPIPVDALQVLNEPQGAFALVAEDGLPETRQEVRELPLPDAFGPLPAHVDADDIHASFGKARHTSEIIYTAKKNDHIHHTHK